MLSPVLLLLLVPVVWYLATRKEPYLLLGLDLVLAGVPGEWVVMNTYVDPTDIVFVSILLRFILGRRGRTAPGVKVPYLRMWVLLGLAISISYVFAENNQGYIRSPLGLVYQLYRYCWKPILYYPLAFMLVPDAVAMDKVLLAMIVGADGCALLGIRDGYAGLRAEGPFIGTNALAGALCMPLLVTAVRFLTEAPGTRMRRFYGLSLILMSRALLFTDSRGATVATLAALGLVGVLQLRSTIGRARLARVAGLGFAGLLVLLAAKPDLFARPHIAYLSTLTQGTDVENFRWRREERWPHFWELMWQHPMLGIGTEEDPTLGVEGNTPHNGYMALAVKHGIPVAVMYIFFAFVAFRRTLRMARYSKVAGTMGLSIAGALTALLLHNIVDATLLIPFVTKIFWLLTAMAIGAKVAEQERVAPKPVVTAAAA